MIILADVPFFDAFMYAKKMTVDTHMAYWSPGEPMPVSKDDIFAEHASSSVCFATELKDQSDFNHILHLNNNFKVIVIWNSNFESLKKFIVLNSLEYKYVQIPKYIDLKNSILQSANLHKDVLKRVVDEVSVLPVSEKLNRDNVSSIVHKISTSYGSNQYPCQVGDIMLGLPASLLDLTSAFCKSEQDFAYFCYYHFYNKDNIVSQQLRNWINFMSRFLISGGDNSHVIYKTGFSMSGKLSEMINQKLNGLIKQESTMFCSLCWTHVMHLDGFEESVLAMTSMRAAISGKLNKKDSINIIRNLDE